MQIKRMKRYQWFEVEFLCGRRQARACVSRPTSEWEVIDRHVQECDDTVYRGMRMSECAVGQTNAPFRFLRLVNEGPNWDGESRRLMFRHFDVYGYFIRD